MRMIHKTDWSLRRCLKKTFHLNQIDNILWSDEAHFHLSGELSSTFGYIWSKTNPHCFVEKPLHSPKLTVFLAFLSKFILEPYFYKIGETIRKESYINMIQTHLISALKRK